MAVTNNLCRVTVVAPNTRMDVALPDHVRLCELQSDLLRHAADGPQGEDLLDDGAAQGGWVLTRLGGAALDANLTPRQLDIADGEELYFTPISQAGPQVVFDDIIDAMATANAERGPRWQATTSSRFGIACTMLALLGAATAALFTGSEAAMWTSFGVATGLLCTGLIFARALGRATEATVVGLLSLPFALVGGLLTLGTLSGLGEVSAPRLMVAGAAVATFAVAAGIGVPTSAPIFQCAALSATALTGAATLCTFAGASPAESGAVVAAVMLGLIPAMPMLAFRVSRLPMPTVPRSPQQLRADTQNVDGETALARSERADQHLSGMLTAAAFAAAGAEIFLALDGSLPATILATLFVALVFMRARIFGSIRQRMPFLLATVVGIAALALATWESSETATERFVWVTAGLIVVAAIALSYVVGIVGKPIAPTWGRFVDVLEVIAFIAVVPLTLWVWDAYWWVRTVNG